MSSKQKLYLARLRRKGKIFEIILDPNKIEEVVEFKEGRKKDIDISSVLYVDEIFINARTGDRAPEDLLKKAFGTTDVYKIAKIILKEGQLEIPVEIRRKELEEKYKRLISILAQYARDPKTGLPIPVQRIENALEKAKVTIRDSVPVEFQIKKVLEKLLPIIPIEIRKKKYKIIIPSRYSLQVFNAIKNYVTILREQWLNDGSLYLEVELYEPQEVAIINYLNKITDGNIEISEI